LKPQDFDKEEAADSMQAAASRLRVPLELVKHCKRQGSRAFKGSRVYLRPLAEMIANQETEADTILFSVPTGPGASSETVEEFRDLLRVAIRCRFLQPSEILEILLTQIINRLDYAFLSTISTRPKREAKVFDKLTRAIHEGFGLALMILDVDATDKYLRRSAATLERARNKLFHSDSMRRASK
jgi:hypothetical protein